MYKASETSEYIDRQRNTWQVIMIGRYTYKYVNVHLWAGKTLHGKCSCCEGNGKPIHRILCTLKQQKPKKSARSIFAAQNILKAWPSTRECAV